VNLLYVAVAVGAFLAIVRLFVRLLRPAPEPAVRRLVGLRPRRRSALHLAWVQDGLVIARTASGPFMSLTWLQLRDFAHTLGATPDGEGLFLFGPKPTEGFYLEPEECAALRPEVARFTRAFEQAYELQRAAAPRSEVRPS